MKADASEALITVAVRSRGRSDSMPVTGENGSCVLTPGAMRGDKVYRANRREDGEIKIHELVQTLGE